MIQPATAIQAHGRRLCRRRAPATAGFTVLELIAVILVLMVIAAAGIPVFIRAARTARLNTAARQVGGYLRGIRYRAINEGVFAHLRWGNLARADGAVYGFMEACVSARRAAPPAAWWPLDAGYEPASGLLLPNGIQFESAGALAFLPDGSVDTSANMVVEHTSNPAEERQIRVYAGAGVIE